MNTKGKAQGEVAIIGLPTGKSSLTISTKAVGRGAACQPWMLAEERAIYLIPLVTALCYYRRENQGNLVAAEGQKNRSRIATTERLTARLERRAAWAGFPDLMPVASGTQLKQRPWHIRNGF